MLLPLAAPAACSTDGPRGGPFRLDRCDEFEATGIYSRRNQQRLDALLIAGAFGTALWEGTDSELGRSAWKSVDAMATAAIATEAMKALFQRSHAAVSIRAHFGVHVRRFQTRFTTS